MDRLKELAVEYYLLSSTEKELKKELKEIYMKAGYDEESGDNVAYLDLKKIENLRKEANKDCDL